jgi:uncharacterized membrane protein YphA (DoxX/SURF4 family)
MLAVGSAQPVGAAGPPIVRGTVVNRSATPQRPVSGAAVVLQVRRDGRTLATIRGRTDARGAFTLTAPPLPPHASYAIVTTYRGVPYSVSLTPRQVTRPVQVPVYDTTTSDADLAAMRVVVGLRRTGRGLAVIEQWTFVNAGTRTDVGADAASGRGAVRFPLPPGATHVSIRDLGPAPATASVQHGDVVVNTILRPATGMNAASLHQARFTFDVPSSAGHPTLLVPTRYFIGRLVVFTIGSHLIAPGFTKTTLPVGAQQVPALQAQAVPPGSTLAIGVDGPPAVASVVPSAPARPAPFPLKEVLILIEAGFGCLLVLGLRRRMSTPAGPRDRLSLQRERARLIGAIAELDLQHERGHLAEVEYWRRRAQEKGHLLGVARQLGE